MQKYKIIERNYVTINHDGNFITIADTSRIHNDNYTLENAFNELDRIYKNGCDFINSKGETSPDLIYNKITRNINTCSLSLKKDNKLIRKYFIEGME